MDDINTLRRILKESRVIAVVGLSADWYRPSYFAAKYMQEHGYRIIPVNPKYPSILGETCYRSWTMTAAEARARQAVPVGLLEGGRVLKAVRKGALLTVENAAPDASTNLFRLRKLQDEMLAGMA